MIAIVYIFRIVAFFTMTSDDTSDNRKSYYDMQKTTCYPLAFIAVAYNVINYFEWAHFPMFPFITWAILGLLNYQHTNLLKNFWEQNYTLSLLTELTQSKVDSLVVLTTEDESKRA